MALCSIAIGVLYPGSTVVIASRTGDQARLVLEKIHDVFARIPDIAREIDTIPSVKSDKSVCLLKNGSKLMSATLPRARGLRAKILIIDEAPEVPADKKEAILRPIRNEKRLVCGQNNLRDFPSKMVSITSACQKGNPFFKEWLETLRRMGRGDPGQFACALDYRSAARVGITEMEYFTEEKKNMPTAKFLMEYGSVFVGAEENSVFPYDLTEPCRSLRDIETAMPKGSTAQYVMSLDIATSSRATSDNAVLCVVKLIEKEDGTYIKELKCIRSYNGKRISY